MKRPSDLYARQWSGKKLLLVHRMRAERALGKPLPPKAVVHHADGSHSADAPLVVCPGQKYHKLLHSRMAVFYAGGDPNTQRLCKTCGAVKDLSFFRVDKGGGSRCRPCRTADRYRYARSR